MFGIFGKNDDTSGSPVGRGRAALLRTEGVDFLRTFTDDAYNPPERSEFEIWVRTRLWGLLWSDHDELEALRSLEPVVEESRKLAAERNWASSPLHDWPKSKPPAGIDAWRFTFASAIQRSDTALGVIRSALKIDVERQLATAAVAIKRFALKHGRNPGNLEAMVPEFLPEVPTDCMTGKPLLYRRDGDRGFVLYSAGADGTDDGGDAFPIEAKRGRSIHSGRDVLWPIPGKTGAQDPNNS